MYQGETFATFCAIPETDSTIISNFLFFHGRKIPPIFASIFILFFFAFFLHKAIAFKEMSEK